MGINIGFVSTRLAGTDGVSLEACKWAQVLTENGHRCFWFAGELDQPPPRGWLVPEAHFADEANAWINAQVFGRKGRKPAVTRVIHELRQRLKARLHEFIHANDIRLLVAQNALTIPMHIPLGLALTETIAETELPTVAHHHDFFWERVRYSVNAAGDYLRMAFPPKLPNIQHVVINSEAQEQLALRTGIASVIIPNVLDFENPPAPDPAGIERFRRAIGLADGDRLILQPTRVVQRKGIEHAIALVHALDDERNKLVISHEAGDEGFAYADWLRNYARENRVDLRLMSMRLAPPWTCDSGGCTLWDVYAYADFITYPSLYEGFGNAFLEAIYFRKPVLVNRYANFVRDIEPLRFDLAIMDGYLSRETVETVAQLLTSSIRRDIMVSHNYHVAARHYAYGILRERLGGVLRQLLGTDIAPLRPPAARPAPRPRLDATDVSVKHFRSVPAH